MTGKITLETITVEEFFSTIRFLILNDMIDFIKDLEKKKSAESDVELSIREASEKKGLSRKTFRKYAKIYKWPNHGTASRPKYKLSECLIK
jgi:ACT domain-containing protein